MIEPHLYAPRLRKMPRDHAVQVLKGDPELLAAMKTERVRLSGKRGGVPLVDCCWISRETHRALTDILQQVEAL